MSPDLAARARALPEEPGCYVFASGRGAPLYVGKAKCLRRRVLSYFAQGVQGKFRAMLREARGIEALTAGSDIEALLLEHRLIKKHRPPYNSAMNADFEPWFLIADPARGLRVAKEAGPSGAGPFGGMRFALEALEIVAKCFGIPSCNGGIRGRMCIRGHTKDCFAPCRAGGAGGGGPYGEAALFLRGESAGIFSALEARMLAAAEKMEYEKAARLKARRGALMRLSAFLGSAPPPLAGRRYAAFLKSRHEECFMLACLDDGACAGRALVRGPGDVAPFAGLAARGGRCRHAEDGAAFVAALPEIGAGRRFLEIGPPEDSAEGRRRLAERLLGFCREAGGFGGSMASLP